MANLTPQGGNADLAGRTVTTIDGYEVTYDAAGFARRSVSPDGQVKNYDALGNQVGFPTTLEVSPAVDPNAPVLPVSTQMPITDTIPDSSIQQTPSETTSPYGEQNDPPNIVNSTGPTPPQDEFGNLEAAQAAAAERAPETISPEDVQAGLDDALANQSQEEDTEPRVYTAEDLGVEEEGFFSGLLTSGQQYLNRAALKSEDALNATAEQAAKLKAQSQATLNARYKAPSTGDWRVRLTLAGNSDYLYKAPAGELGDDLLRPLRQSNGVIFPYTPTISTSYSAYYDKYDLVHSNYRGYFYKNSAVNDINITATFTAQDTWEAQYLLAVIHFFRSATKMFYGKDTQRGAPPPLLYLFGHGQYQFNGHPCVVSNFNYNLPTDVDYIRCNAINNYGTNLLNRLSGTATNSALNWLSSAWQRLNNSSLPKNAEAVNASPGVVPGNLSNTTQATYVPTKMEISITLLPVQTRAQVSQQFSLKNFANGNLLKGGFW